MSLRVCQVELSAANSFVAALHRHHKPVVGHRFSIGAAKGGVLIGVCIVGRPIARMTDPQKVLEVTRLCTDGTRNACSFLYAAAARAGQVLGYERIQTFVLEHEPATTLRAAGWAHDHVTNTSEQWHSRDGRRTGQPYERKQRWSKPLNAPLAILTLEDMLS